LPVAWLFGRQFKLVGKLSARFLPLAFVDPHLLGLLDLHHPRLVNRNLHNAEAQRFDLLDHNPDPFRRDFNFVQWRIHIACFLPTAATLALIPTWSIVFLNKFLTNESGLI
jgi:hypothetical protein